jgi:hypothetical protein
MKNRFVAQYYDNGSLIQVSRVHSLATVDGRTYFKRWVKSRWNPFGRLIVVGITSASVSVVLINRGSLSEVLANVGEIIAFETQTTIDRINSGHLGYELSVELLKNHCNYIERKIEIEIKRAFKP